MVEDKPRERVFRVRYDKADSDLPCEQVKAVSFDWESDAYMLVLRDGEDRVVFAAPMGNVVSVRDVTDEVIGRDM